MFVEEQGANTLSTLEDINKALQLSEQAVSLLPDVDPKKQAILTLHAVISQEYIKQMGGIPDISETPESTLSFAPSDNSNKDPYHLDTRGSLALALLERFQDERILRDAEGGIKLLQQTSLGPSAT